MLSKSRNFIVGLFVLTGCAIFSFMVVMVGKERHFLSESHEIHARFDDIKGLRLGAVAQLAGIPVGSVKRIGFFSTDKGTVIRLTMRVVSKYFHMIRQDSVVSIATRGVLGDKYIQISMGSTDSPLLKPGGFLIVREHDSLLDQLGTGKGLAQRIEQAVVSINEVLDQLKADAKIKKTVSNIHRITERVLEILAQVNDPESAIGTLLSKGNDNPLNRSLMQVSKATYHIENIFKKIDVGEGTLGALVNDPTLHEDLKILFGGAKRNALIKFMVRESVKHAEQNLTN